MHAVLYIITILYMLIIVWRVICGSREAASFEVNHYDAGAGDDVFLYLLLVTVIILSFGIYVFIKNKRSNHRLISFVIVVSVPFAFYSMASSQQRFGEMYTENSFSELEKINEGISKQEVENKIGDPLMVELSADGGERWSYTYMPSTGFGWSKRVVEFDKNGISKRIFSMEEP